MEELLYALDALIEKGEEHRWAVVNISVTILTILMTMLITGVIK